MTGKILNSIMELMPLRRGRKNLQRKKKKMANNEAEVIVKPENPLSNFPKPLLIGALILILATVAFVSYFLGSTTKSQPVSEEQKEAMIKEADLPLPASILQNPLIYEWKGSVEGVLIAKTDTNITLGKNGKRITITVLKNYTKFYRLPSSQELSLADIPLNSSLRGDIIITKEGHPQLTVPGEVVGGIFHLPSIQR